MAPSKRKMRSVPRRIGEANPPGIFSKAKCVFVSLAGSEYHQAKRIQPAPATRASSQSARSVVDRASRRADQLEPAYCLLRTCAIPTHHALVPLHVHVHVHVLRSLCSAGTEKTLEIDRSLADTRRLRAAQVLPAGWRQLQDSRQALPSGTSTQAEARASSAWTSLCEQDRMDR